MVFVMIEESPVTMTELAVTATPLNIIFVTRKIIRVSYVFFQAVFKCVIRTALSPTVFVRQNFLKCNCSEFSFFVTLPVCFKHG